MATYTDTILDSVDDGSIDRNELIVALLKWLGESDVKLFCQMNCLVERVNGDSDLDGPDEQRAWYDTSAELM